jgi:hypothetical protein
MKQKISLVLISLLILFTIVNLSVTVLYACYPDGCEDEANDTCEDDCSTQGGCDGVYMIDSWCSGLNECGSVWWIWCNQGSPFKFYCYGEDYSCY